MSGPWEKYQQAPEPGPWVKYQAAPAVEAAPDPTVTMGTGERLAAGAGRSVVETGRGLKQMLDSGAAWLERNVPGGEALSRATGGRTAADIQQQTNAEVADARRLDAPLMSTTAGKVGNIAGQVAQLALPGSYLAKAAPTTRVGAAFTAVAPRAAPYVGAAAEGAAFAGAQPVVGDESRLVNATEGAALGAGGRGVADVAGAGVRKLVARGAQSAAANATRDATLAAGREVGYAVTPSQVGAGGIVNSALEALGGKVKTQQAVSVKNADVTNSLARKALGMADNAPITPEALGAIRANAGKAFENLKRTGTVSADEVYGDALNGILKKYEGAASAFPGLAKPEIEALVTSLRQPQFGADAAVDAIRVLRENASAAYAKGDKGLGKATREASEALESLMERHLQAQGKGALLKEFRDARALIAKTYSVESALINGTGNVSAKKLGAQVSKGKPLSGELRTAGEFSNAFPKATQDAVDVPPWSILDVVGASGATMAGSPALAGLLAARPVARAAITSPAYQRAMINPTYGPGRLTRAAAPALETDIARMFLTASGINAAQQ